jgi:predicted HTH transcriptional regulator
MDTMAVKEMLAKGEDSVTQFKENIFNTEQLAQEMIAFANNAGGTIVIGVKDSGEIAGLTDDDIDMELFKEFHLKKYDLPFEGGIDQLPQPLKTSIWPPRVI